MKHSRLVLYLAITGFLVVVPASGQLQHFNPISGTGVNATLVVPASINPIVDGDPMAAGDEIGVFSPGGINVGAGVWNSENLGITVWGDNVVTGEVDGMVEGDTILIRVWDQSEDNEIEGVIVTYSQGNGIYSNNDTFVLSSLEADSSLPVELAGIEAVADNGDVILRWKTLSEFHNVGFEVQYRRDDDAYWNIEGFVNGRGTTSEEISYSYRVVGLDYGRHVFRLRQVDLDGSFSYSPEVAVSVDAATGFLVEAPWPNPCTYRATIGFHIPEARNVTISLSDILGREVTTLHSGTLGTGRHTLELDATDLPSGIYLYRLHAGDFVETKHLVVVK